VKLFFSTAQGISWKTQESRGMQKAGSPHWISDDAGRNQLTFEDGAGQTTVAGKDLYVIVNKNPIAVVDDWLGNEDAFDGIDTGKGTRSIDDLMATNADAGPSLTGQAAGSSANELRTICSTPG
jgi:hypothetical protein